jgi:hypothetical protein
MSNETGIADVFGESFEEQFIQAQRKRWGISEALTTEFTSREKNPPRDVSKTKRMRIRLGNVSRYIIRIAKSEYKLTGETETVKKLLRCGLQELHSEWEEEINRLAEINEAITHSSGYLNQDVTISLADEDWELSIESKESTSRYYILWYQDFHADELSKELNIPVSHILELAIIMAGRELKMIGEVPSEKGREIIEIIEMVDEQLNQRKSNLEQLAHGAMLTAWSNENSESLHKKLREECPTVIESFSDEVDRISESLGE